MKSAAFTSIDQEANALIALSDHIHAHPELGNEEHEAVSALTAYLAAHGFTVTTGVAGLPTAFRATYSSGSGRPRLGLLCEYDALPGLGHACAHNLQGPAIAGAAVALASAARGHDFAVEVFGTPAEETTSGKNDMIAAGLFDGLDAALMMHGGDRTTVDTHSLALTLLEFNFSGVAAHAAVAPEKGVSALDGVLLMFNAIEYLREHVRDDVRIHGVITDGGKAANIVPARAAAEFYVRARDRAYLDTVVARVRDCANGAALATGAKVEIVELKAYDNKINVPALNELLLANARLAGAANVTPPRDKTGSTDFASVAYRLPGAALRVAFAPYGTASHSTEWASAAGSASGHQAMLAAAKALAGTCVDLVEQPTALARIKADFAKAKAELAG